MQASTIYQQILSNDPMDVLTLKRQICLAKVTGSREITIKLLNEFLTVFQNDTEAWMELAELYLEANIYQYAAHCFEELILLHPQNYHYYVKYGEVLYTIGGHDNLLLAGKQFSFSLELSTKNNNSAWWGLILVAHAVLSSKHSSAKDAKTYSELFQLASSQISQIYQSKNHSKLYIVSKTLEKLNPPVPKHPNPVSSNLPKPHQSKIH